MSTTFRDEELGAALRQLEVPEHRPEFHAELRRLLAREHAWRLEVKAVPSAIARVLTGDRFAITVDRATGMPVEVTETFRGEFRRQIRIEQLAIDPPVDRDDLTLDFPPDAKPSDLEHGFQRSSSAKSARS